MTESVPRPGPGWQVRPRAAPAGGSASAIVRSPPPLGVAGDAVPGAEDSGALDIYRRCRVFHLHVGIITRHGHVASAQGVKVDD